MSWGLGLGLGLAAALEMFRVVFGVARPFARFWGVTPRSRPEVMPLFYVTDRAGQHQRVRHINMTTSISMIG